MTRAAPMPPKSCCFGPISTVGNNYTGVSLYSSDCPYDAVVPAIQYRHNPYQTTATRQYRMKVVNLSFARADTFESDLKVLVHYLSSHVIPRHVEATGLCPDLRCFARVLGLDRLDRETDPKGRPSKERHAIIETNYPNFNELLHSQNLYILADRNCFHVCWHGTVAMRATGEEVHTITHDVGEMHKFCDGIRSLGLRARHRATDGLPSTAVKFDCLKLQ